MLNQFYIDEDEERGKEKEKLMFWTTTMLKWKKLNDMNSHIESLFSGCRMKVIERVVKREKFYTTSARILSGSIDPLVLYEKCLRINFFR